MCVADAAASGHITFTVVRIFPCVLSFYFYVEVPEDGVCFHGPRGVLGWRCPLSFYLDPLMNHCFSKA